MKCERWCPHCLSSKPMKKKRERTFPIINWKRVIKVTCLQDDRQPLSFTFLDRNITIDNISILCIHKHQSCVLFYNFALRHFYSVSVDQLSLILASPALKMRRECLLISSGWGAFLFCVRWLSELTSTHIWKEHPRTLEIYRYPALVCVQSATLYLFSSSNLRPK